MKRIKPGAAECGALGSILKLDLRQEECCPWANRSYIKIKAKRRKQNEQETKARGISRENN